MFRHEYVAAREEKTAVLEQHVAMTNSEYSSVDTQGKGEGFKVIRRRVPGRFMISFTSQNTFR